MAWETGAKCRTTENIPFLLCDCASTYAKSYQTPTLLPLELPIPAHTEELAPAVFNTLFRGMATDGLKETKRGSVT